MLFRQRDYHINFLKGIDTAVLLPHSVTLNGLTVHDLTFQGESSR
jgi:hypothetical protein